MPGTAQRCSEEFAMSKFARLLWLKQIEYQSAVQHNLFTMGPSAQQQRMQAGTCTEVARAAKQNFDTAQCPFVSLFQGSGACGSESTWTCCYLSKELRWWDGFRNCSTCGIVARNNQFVCELLVVLYRRRLVDEFLRVRKFQSLRDVLFKRCYAGHVCWWIYR